MKKYQQRGILLFLVVIAQVVVAGKPKGRLNNLQHIKDVKTYITQPGEGRQGTFALHLKNHFGYPSANSPYAGGGPKINPKRLFFKNKHGDWTKAIVPKMDVSALVGESCDQKQSAYYDHCTKIDNCEECQINMMCGWCKVSQKCNVRMKKGCVCTNICDFEMDPDTQCPSSSQIKVHGNIEQVSPISQGMISAELVRPKYRKRERKYEIVPDYIHVPIGRRKQRTLMSFLKRGQKNQYNELQTHWTDYYEPVYSRVKARVLRENVTEELYDAQTLQKVHPVNHTEFKILHGIQEQEQKQRFKKYHGIEKSKYHGIDKVKNQSESKS